MEAKQRAKGNSEEEDVGRGCRAIKPREYFSPGEEDDRARGQRKKEGKTATKKGNWYSPTKTVILKYISNCILIFTL